MALSADQWTQVRATQDSALDHGYIDAMKAIKLSASEGSAMRKAVRDALRSRLDVITRDDRLHFSDSADASESAAGALLSRDQLTPEQFELLISPFVAAGMPSSTFDAEAS